MAGQFALYVSTVGGAVVLLGICAFILVRKHNQDCKEQQQEEEIIQQRLQHATENNLPPFYIDHELDPVCVYEHELPPDVIPPAEAILVHSSTAEELIIPPEEDPLLAGASSPALLRNLSSSMTMAAAVETPLPLSPALPQQQQQQPADMETTTLGTTPLATAVATAPGQEDSSFVSTPQLVLSPDPDLASLPPPPSYDVPNRVVDRSPMTEWAPSPASSAGFATPSLIRYPESAYVGSPMVASPSPSMAVPSPVTNDYFGHRPQQQQQQQNRYDHRNPYHRVDYSHYRARSHTISHSPATAPVQDQTPPQQQQQGEEEALPETPRYSLEFPSTIPHEQHLQRHQLARAMSAVGPSSFSSSPSSTATDQHPFQSFQMAGRSYSQPYSITSSSPGRSLEEGLSPQMSPSSSSTSSSPSTATRPYPRSRASTLGDSSKLLILRMQALWRKSASANASTVSLVTPSQTLAQSETVPGMEARYQGHQDRQNLGLGLGLELGDMGPPLQVVTQEPGQAGEVVEEEENDGNDKDDEEEEFQVVVATTATTEGSLSSSASASSSSPLSASSIIDEGIMTTMPPLSIPLAVS